MGASIIKKASIQDIPEIIGILENRVNWLKEKRINQWNDGYTSKYNYQYFEDKMKKGDDVYIVFHDEKPTACMMLEKKSDFFKDVFTFNCCYVRHLASIEKGAGEILLNFAEDLCLQSGKSFLNTNCNRENEKLVSYYKERGFLIVGEGVKKSYPYYLLVKQLT